jgi:hypothetical protein
LAGLNGPGCNGGCKESDGGEKLHPDWSYVLVGSHVKIFCRELGWEKLRDGDGDFGLVELEVMIP